MSDQIKQHRAEMERQAWPVVEQFVREHPHYSVDANQSGSQSVTNYVIFGHRQDQADEQRVIFKYFCRDERKQRELFALHHWAATGIVPHLLADDGPRLIVVSYIPGAFLPWPEDDPAGFQAVDRAAVGRTLGAATARLISTPLTTQAAQEFESRFYDGEPLTAYFQGILQASQAIHQRVACYQDEAFGRSLAQIEENLPHILAQPRLLYHQDAANMHFVGHRFSGFFDLEMCRVGTEAMQIGSLWAIIASYGVWEPFVQGFAEVTGRTLGTHELAASRAFAHFMVWRSISDYGDWHGEPRSAEQDEAEIEVAERHRRAIKRNNSLER